MCGTKHVGWKWLMAAIVAGGMLLPTAAGMGQDAGGAAETKTAATADASAKAPTAGEQQATTPPLTAPAAESETIQPTPDSEPAKNAVKSDEAKTESKVPAEGAIAPAAGSTAPQVTSSTGQTTAAPTRVGNSPFVI